MAPLKRKDGPTNESFVRTKTTFDSDGRPQKRVRKSGDGLAEQVISKDASAKPASTIKTYQQPPKISKLKEEEPAFPRGGASVLTPLEHKQIQIEATRDVLFEQQNGPSTTADVGSKKRKTKGRKKDEETGPAEETIKIEGLSYKRIVPGSLVLGQVSQINRHDIALALPNNLTGYVPITSISEQLTERIEKLVNLEDDDEKTDDEEDTDEDILLEEMFTIGQYLRAYVTSTSDGSTSNGTTKAKRRIELSLDPRQSNSGLSIKELVANAMVMASVVSVEDHGLVMSLGLENRELKGFMSSKEVGHHVDTSKIKEGAVYMCMMMGLNPNGKIVKLCADTLKMANLKKGNYLGEAPTIDAFLPGTAVEVLVEDVTSKGIAGKVMGFLDVTADLMHSGARSSNQSIEKKYKVGTKVKGRIICTFPNSEPKKLGISLQEHVLALGPQLSLQKDDKKHDPLDVLPLSSVVESVTVRNVQPGVGLFVDVGVKGVPGFVHISRIADKKVEILTETTGPYKVGSAHRGRIIGFNPLDGVFLVSLELSTIEQPFLRIEDLKIGEIVKGKIEKIVVNEEGVGGILVNLAEDITGLVPEMHMADVKLLHPERKFKEGMAVTARVLSTDISKRRIRLTLKKTLVHSESPVFKTYEDIAPGMQSPGTLVNILPTGAVVQFFGAVRGFLPVGEMSEAYIQDPSQHFRIGQVVNVHVLSVDSANGRLLVSCKDPSAFGLVQQTAMKNLKLGHLVSGTVTEKSNADVSIELEASGLRAALPLHHLTDNSNQKNLSALKNIRVGQRLVDLVVLEKMDRSHSVLVSNRPSLVKSAKEGTLITEFGDVKETKVVHGFVSNVTPTAVFVKFAGNMTGLLPKSEVTDDKLLLPDFGLRKFQSIATRVLAVDMAQQRFLLTMKLERDSQDKEQNRQADGKAGANTTAVNAVDPSVMSLADLSPGKLTKARIASVKNTQINVQLADNIQGRIDVSNFFDNWEDIEDRKHPLKKFAPKQVIDVRVLGFHDARNHRFLPISHREGKNQVLELSAKPSDLTAKENQILTLDQVEIGSLWIVYVNNISDDCLWVNLSPNIRGRIKTLDLSEDVSLLSDLNANFPIGSAVKVHVKSVDLRNNRLDLSARTAENSKDMTLQNLTERMVVPGKVTKVNEKEVMVQLSDDVSGPVFLTDLADDFDNAITTNYSKNDIIRVCVTSIDLPNKKIRLSTRPSRVLNSSLPVKDPEITSIDQIKVNDIVRGFVKSVSDKGLFVFLGGNVVAYIRISDLSDSFVKDWKSMYQVDQLVKGKVIRCDPDINHVQLSLKASVLDKNYVAPIVFDDLTVGQMITGKVRKVEDYGVFIVVDASANVSGLCHKSQMADQKVDDVRQLYDEGDVVKAIVLKVDRERKRISFGLKASYFEENEGSDEEESDDENEDGMEGVMLEGMSSDEEDDEDGGIELDMAQDVNSGPDDSDDEMEDKPEQSDPAVLDAGGFDWTAGNLDEDATNMDLDSEDDMANENPTKKKRRKPEIKVDRTGDLDAHGPQSVGDYERLLLGQPDSAQLWIEYMAFQMQLSEISKARDVAERAIRTINIREESEKMDVWTALLNLEIAYGSEETVEEAFKRACQHNDPQEMHARLISTYIQSGKHEKADALFQVLVKKFSQSPAVWVNYAHFLMSTMSNPEAARALLLRAKQALPDHALLQLTLKFASLEFNTTSGSPERGRTIFEGLVTTYPKRLDIWNQLLDLEIKQGEKDIVRGIFERGVKIPGLKPKGAKSWFKRWIEWEEKNGDGKSKEKATARAQEWVRAFEEKKAQGSGGA